jgi:hypothetical protein
VESSSRVFGDHPTMKELIDHDPFSNPVADTMTSPSTKISVGTEPFLASRVLLSVNAGCG